MTTQYDIGTTSVGVGSNTTPTWDPSHPGSWNLFGINLPDAGLTESILGQTSNITENNISPTIPTDNGVYISQTPPITNTTQSGPAVDNSSNFLDYYKGWDQQQAQSDFQNVFGGDINKLMTARGVNTGGGTTPPTSTPYVPTKQDLVNQVNTNKGTEVALDYATNYADQMSPDQYYAMIDQEAGNSQNFLNTQEAAIRADQPGIESGLMNQYSTGLTSLQGGKNTAYGKTGIQRQQAGQVKEDALSAARRLYSELQQGYRQRFGGASSAGEAAMALSGNEQQRQMAQTNRGYQNTLGTIGQSEAEIENTYSTNLAQLDQSKNEAINSAQSEFRNQLLEIGKNRTLVESERLAARRQALADLSQKVFAIQQQRTQFQQNIELMREQSRIQQAEALSSINRSTTTGANALSGYKPSTNPTSNLTFGGNQTTASGNQGLQTVQNSVGNISSGMTKNTDPLANGVYPIQTMTDGRTKYSDGSIR